MFIQKITRVSVLAMALCSVAMITSCKSSESAYKKAYEKAQAQAAQNQTATTPATTQQVQIAPVQTQAPAQTIDVSNESVRSESVSLVSGSALRNFSVVCGSFTLQANAEGLQQTLKAKGYDAIIVSAPVNGRKWFRVAAASYDDKVSAVQTRNKLRGTYPDAWVLLKK